MTQWILTGVACVGFGAMAAADGLLALSGDDGVAFWDTSIYPAEARFSGLEGGVPGVCYELSDNRLAAADDVTACLDHMRLGTDVITGGADRYDIIGTLTARPGAVDDFSTGFALTGVAGVDYCGERENCDEIYVLGASSDAALAAMAAAVRAGARVRVQGPGVWNLESIDIVIDQIDPAQ